MYMYSKDEKDDFIFAFVSIFPHRENIGIDFRVLCQDRTWKRFKKHALSNSQVQYFLSIYIASVQFIKNRTFASLSQVDLLFKNEVEGMHRTTLFPVTEGDEIPDKSIWESRLGKKKWCI